MEASNEPSLTRPVGRVASIAREAGGLTDKEHALFESVRDKTPAEPMRFE